MHSIESSCYRIEKCTVCRHVRAAFCLEILQAVAAKGLILSWAIHDLCLYTSEDMKLHIIISNILKRL